MTGIADSIEYPNCADPSIGVAEALVRDVDSISLFFNEGSKDISYPVCLGWSRL